MGENPHSQNQLLNQYISKLEIRFILIDNGLCPDWSREEHTRMRDCFYYRINAYNVSIIGLA